MNKMLEWKLEILASSRSLTPPPYILREFLNASNEVAFPNGAVLLLAFTVYFLNAYIFTIIFFSTLHFSSPSHSRLAAFLFLIRLLPKFALSVMYYINVSLYTQRSPSDLLPCQFSI